MPTPPIITSDLFKWEGLAAYPLSLVSDGNEATADIELIGVLPASGAYAYSFRLQPGIEYRFSDVLAGSRYQAYVSFRDTGDLLWANRAGLDAIGPNLAAPRTIEVGTPKTITLVLRNPTPQELDFDAAAFADEVSVAHLAVYRFTNAETGKTFYTGSEDERQAVINALPQMRYDGPVFYAEDVPKDGFIPVYRFFDGAKGAHFYTANEGERLLIESTMPNLRYEGPSFYVPAVESRETVPVYRLANVVTGAYLYTAVPVEKAYTLLQGNWRDEGIAFYSMSPQSVQSDAPVAHHLADVGVVQLIGEAPPDPGG